MKLRALITKPSSIERFLRYLGEPTDAPPLSAARDPVLAISLVRSRIIQKSDENKA